MQSSYFMNSFTNERNYAITELETLGFVWAAKLFCPKQFGTALRHVNRPCCLYISPQFEEPKLVCCDLIKVSFFATVLYVCYICILASVEILH